MRKRVLSVLAMLTLTGTAVAAPTTITVRVIAKGAKFVGGGVGGALVTLRDADTGELLASGVTEGSTGDTERIMTAPRAPSGVLSSENVAAFTATVDLTRPRRIEATVVGPLAQRGSANRVTSTQWVVPGKDVTGGDGWLLELPGFLVQVTSPATHARIAHVPAVVRISANVTMMCGCHLTPGGTWDADRVTIAASVRKDGRPYRELALAYAGTPSQFAGMLPLSDPGTYEATVYAYDPRDGNTGLDVVTFVVGE